VAPKETNSLSLQELQAVKAELVCDSPNEFLDKWDGNITIPGKKKSHTFNVGLRSLLLRGCNLKNTDYCIGFVVYTG